MPPSSAEVRGQISQALLVDLVGPASGEFVATEELSERPSSFYLTGFLAPQSAPKKQRGGSDDDSEEIEEDGEKAAGDDDRRAEPPTSRRGFFSASMGLTVLVPAEAAHLDARVAWGDYKQDEQSKNWKRTPRLADVPVPLDKAQASVDVPQSGGLQLSIAVREVGRHPRLPAGTRAVSVFLVNDRAPAPDDRFDEAFAFQAELKLRCEQGFVARPDLRSGTNEHFDDQVADLQYRDAFEYAVGHNVGAYANIADGRCRIVSTTFLPEAQVEKVVPAELDPRIELKMEALGACENAAAAREKLGPLMPAYREWIGRQPRDFGDAQRNATARQLLERAERAAARIEAGLAALDDRRAFDAFVLMNRAMARAPRQRAVHNSEKRPEEVDPPAWRPFQLAFILLNLAGLVDASRPDRSIVDLLFFPTGGGKTEAYFGLAAFAILLRRLRDPSARSSGVSVLMRYTLRLLTLDQLMRASTLICALELLRQDDPARLGKWPIEIGLWVGLAATPNIMGRSGDGKKDTARSKVNDFKRDPRSHPSPIPLENCPWCGWRFVPDSFQLLPDAREPRELRIYCNQFRCAFHSNRQPLGLPLVAVDEQLYRRLPAFIIATVDKFAGLPWVGRTGALFGRVDRHDEEGFYGPADPNRGQSLGGMLPAPDLIIQDELHLISGPLGTMVGLYETAIDELCRRGEMRPKIVASTATVRRAARQIQALFGRPYSDIFPPPGPDRRDSFFARTAPASEKNARLYVGVAAQGRNFKVVLMRTHLALLGAAQKAWDASRREKINPADPYMTLLGYFNALRELGGARRIVEDEVTSRARRLSARRRVGESEGLFADRDTLRIEELTSRVKTFEVSRTRQRMGRPASDKEAIDVVLATNMISVGLDETRLGLMVVTGQPKAAAEYIQATSRVGRDENRPGLIVALLNLHKPRDRSHYEHFTCWHESFYRAVEVTSVTPFSPRAIERGIAAVSVSLARLLIAPLTPPHGAAAIASLRGEADRVADLLAERAQRHDNLPAPESEALRQGVRARVRSLLDSWERVAKDRGTLQYGTEVGGPPLLREPLDPDLPSLNRDERQFRAHRSLRDVEPSVGLHLLKD